MRVQRNSRQAVVRIEYLIAGVICAFLIAGMIAVLVKYSRPRVPAFPPVAVRVDDEMPPVVTPTTETVTPPPTVGPGNLHGGDSPATHHPEAFSYHALPRRQEAADRVR